MDYTDIIEKITETLSSLESQGELVLTTQFPGKVAEQLFHAALKSKFDELLDEPIECTMPYLLDLTAKEMSARFALEDARAREIISSYYGAWLKTRTVAEMAQIYWHESPHEMAGRAYYHIELGKPDDRGPDYLDWRRHQGKAAAIP